MKLSRLTIDTNPDECNLHCIMCDTHSIYNKKKYSRKSMPKELLEKILDEAIKLELDEIIPSTMGEPLLYKNFNLFIEKLINTKTKLNLTTNGTFPLLGVEKWAKLLLPVLSDIKISINSIDSKINEIIMINDNTMKKIKNIKKFLKLRDEVNPDVTITLQVTFLKSNLNHLEDIIKFAIKNNIDRVKGHHLWITYDEIANESLQLVENVETWNKFVDKIEKYKSQIKLVNFEKIRLNNGKIPDDYICPFLGKELWIDHEGNFNVCCAPSEKRKSLGYFGNINNLKIKDVFYSKKYLDLIKNYKKKEICQNCSLRIPK